MNFKNPKDKELHSLVEQLAEASEVQKMTDLLVSWEEKSLLWLIFVESRIVAPSSTEEQVQTLKKAKEIALEKDKTLLEEFNAYMNGDIDVFEEDSDDEDLDDEFDDSFEDDFEDDDETPLTPNQQKKKEQLEQLMEDADNLQYEDVMKSIETYKKAINLMDKEPRIKDNYYYLYAHYIMSILYPQLGDEYDEEIVAYSKKGLDYAESTYINAPFTDIGKFYKEAIIACCNAIVWHSLPTTNTKEGLEELLVYANKGCKYATIEDCPNLYGTKASLLLKLGRKEKGYQLIWTIKNNNADKHTYNHIAKLKDYKKWEENQNKNLKTNQNMKNPKSFILSEEASKNETAEQAYQRLLEAEKVIATSEAYPYFKEYNEYREGWREKEAEKTTTKEIEKWEKKHFKLDESFKNFILKYGYISFGEDAYGLWELNNDVDTLANAFSNEFGFSEEEIEECYEGDVNHLENLFVIGNGDEGLQIHYYILMDKEGGFYLFDQDDWDTIDERYTFDELVSKIANLVIEWMLED